MAQKHGFFKIVGSWPLTLKGYGTMLESDMGLAVLALGAAGLVVFLIAERMSARSVPILGLLSIIPFFLVTLENGMEPISVPSEGGLLNYRFGLIVAIPAALLAGYLLSKIPGPAMIAGSLLVIVGAAGLSGLALRQHQVVLATEASQDLFAQRYQVQAGDFLVSHTSGLVLMDIVQNERADFPVIDRTVYDGTKESGTNQWAAVLRDPPAFHVNVIVMRLPAIGEPPDVVYGALNSSLVLRRHYRLIDRTPAYLIYRLRTGLPTVAWCPWCVECSWSTPGRAA